MNQAFDTTMVPSGEDSKSSGQTMADMVTFTLPLSLYAHVATSLIESIYWG